MKLKAPQVNLIVLIKLGLLTSSFYKNNTHFICDSYRQHDEDSDDSDDSDDDDDAFAFGNVIDIAWICILSLNFVFLLWESIIGGFL